MRLTPGQRLGPYEVLSVLGADGMAEVYRARDGRLGREVALKVVNFAFSSSPELLKRFEQEARLAGSLNHPNLVAVYDVGQHDGVPYFVTELLEGESLRSRADGSRVPIPGVEADAVPRGWAGPGELWMSRGGDRPPARARLFRVQLASGRTLEEREVGPTDATGANGIGQVLVSEDGRLTA